jgi:predicted site-specific integrase-resolvase
MPPDQEIDDMPPTERNDLAIQVAELRSDVRHVQSDITDIKADVRELNVRMEAKFAAVDKRFEGVDKKVDELKDSLASFRSEIKDALSTAKMWAWGMYVALAGTLLYVIARGAKWI